MNWLRGRYCLREIVRFLRFFKFLRSLELPKKQNGQVLWPYLTLKYEMLDVETLPKDDWDWDLVQEYLRGWS